MTWLRITCPLHLALALGLTIGAAPIPERSLVLLFCMCVLMSQASLLGVWVASTTARGRRQVGLFCTACVILVAETFFAAKVNLFAATLLALAPTACLAGLLYRARQHVRIQRCPPNSELHVQPLQVSISQILGFTAGVAVFLAVAKELAHVSRTVQSVEPLVRVSIDSYLLDMLSFSLCAVPVASCCVWLTLSNRRSRARLVVLFLLPVATGMLPTVFRTGHEWWIFVFASVVMELIVGSTLLLARFDRYRLVGPVPDCLPPTAEGLVSQDG